MDASNEKTIRATICWKLVFSSQSIIFPDDQKLVDIKMEATHWDVGLMLKGCTIENIVYRCRNVYGGPAYDSKLLSKGDKILTVDHKPVTPETAPSAIIGSDVPGTFVTLQIRHQNNEITEVKLRRVASEIIADRRAMFEIFTSLKNRAKDEHLTSLLDEAISLWTKMLKASADHDRKISENVVKLQNTGQNSSKQIQEILEMLKLNIEEEQVFPFNCCSVIKPWVANRFTKTQMNFESQIQRLQSELQIASNTIEDLRLQNIGAHNKIIMLEERNFELQSSCEECQYCENQIPSVHNWNSSLLELQDEWTQIADDMEQTHRKVCNLMDNYYNCFDNAYDQQKLARKTVMHICHRKCLTSSLKAGLIMDGCTIHGVIFGSPAHIDGTLQIGDVVTKIDDHPASPFSIENIDADESDSLEVVLTFIDHQEGDILNGMHTMKALLEQLRSVLLRNWTPQNNQTHTSSSNIKCTLLCMLAQLQRIQNIVEAENSNAVDDHNCKFPSQKTTIGLVLNNFTVSHVVPGSPAYYCEDIGIGDTILNVDGKSFDLEMYEQFQDAVIGCDVPGTYVTLTLMKGNREDEHTSETDVVTVKLQRMNRRELIEDARMVEMLTQLKELIESKEEDRDVHISMKSGLIDRCIDTWNDLVLKLSHQTVSTRHTIEKWKRKTIPIFADLEKNIKHCISFVHIRKNDKISLINAFLKKLIKTDRKRRAWIQIKQLTQSQKKKGIHLRNIQQRTAKNFIYFWKNSIGMQREREAKGRRA
eukprot:765084-Hanusia_phi.AAC.2